MSSHWIDYNCRQKVPVEKGEKVAIFFVDGCEELARGGC
jgi:hypothetical protein